jgi:hypothetical protein
MLIALIHRTIPVLDNRGKALGCVPGGLLYHANNRSLVVAVGGCFANIEKDIGNRHG